MQLKDLLGLDIKDIRVAKQKSVLRHALKKKKTNPKESRTDDMNNFVDVFGGMAGYNGDSDGSVIDDSHY